MVGPSCGLDRNFNGAKPEIAVNAGRSYVVRLRYQGEAQLKALLVRQIKRSTYFFRGSRPVMIDPSRFLSDRIKEVEYES